MSDVPLSLSRRQRATPFEARMLEHRPKGMAIYNHMTIPTVFESLEADFDHLREHVQLWDVGCERQVEVAGADALKLAELTTPRDLSDMRVGQGRYAPLVDEHGGIVNDPIILKLAEDRYWFSIADSDVLLWLKGLATGFGLDVRVSEPDVSPLALQGPKAEDVLASVVGEHVRDIRFFWFIEETVAGAPVLIARSGWSGQGGFELYLMGSEHGEALWDALFEAGKPYQIRSGCPNLIERLETGLLSYGNDMTLENNPYECGLDRFFTLGKQADYLGKEALERIAAHGVQRRLVKLFIDHDGPVAMRDTLPVLLDDKPVGYVTSQSYTRRYGGILALAYVEVAALSASGRLLLVTPEHGLLPADYRPDGWGEPR